ncbi:hypothetical protein PHMEG_00012001 [Phytophthora megakarya]|uniref:Uncharacterized protein n=1 Tax=Phytophthora megakarya TaxID=4795 RepID=A0A225WCE5_9STRA|nr:hypothetical protein PHMEG_00012001 [Phytophthora megakarya]
MVTLVPDPAFSYNSGIPNEKPSVITASVQDYGSRNYMQELDKVLQEGLEVDFEGSKLSSELQRLQKDLLEQFRDMFVETS